MGIIMAQEPEQVFGQKSNRTITITIASISSIFVIFIVVLWRSGFLTFTGSDPSSKIVAAALALVGGLIAAVVSIVGILLKYSIDQRTESRLQIEANRVAADRKTESDRANALQTQAEQRLSLEAAIRAVELLGGTKDSTNALQQAGALFALSNLDQHQLTLDLASYLLKRNSLEPSTASRLIDRALRRSDPIIQLQAMETLHAHAGHMITPSSLEFPSSIVNWDSCLSTAEVRQLAVLAASMVLLSRQLPAWQTHLPEVAGIVAIMALAWEAEADERLKSEFGAILKSVLQAFPDFSVIYHPKKPIDAIQLTKQVENCKVSSYRTYEVLKQLESWKSAATPP